MKNKKISDYLINHCKLKKEDEIRISSNIFLQLLPLSLIHKESTMHQYMLLAKIKEQSKMEKLYWYSINYLRFGLQIPNIYKGKKALFPIRLLELLLLPEAVLKFFASSYAIDFLYINIFKIFSKK
ncbi:MAG: hypothetical protein JSW06_08560 [Thermoplasmatales archaeon]|nr:MAG: hypothetical protein JSW06_08560 [Thermoplasmatales archaeon]